MMVVLEVAFCFLNSFNSTRGLLCAGSDWCGAAAGGIPEIGGGIDIGNGIGGGIVACVGGGGGGMIGGMDDWIGFTCGGISIPGCNCTLMGTDRVNDKVGVEGMGCIGIGGGVGFATQSLYMQSHGGDGGGDDGGDGGGDGGGDVMGFGSAVGFTPFCGPPALRP